MIFQTFFAQLQLNAMFVLHQHLHYFKGHCLLLDSPTPQPRLFSLTFESLIHFEIRKGCANVNNKQRI
jgi:hypothetical protein